MVTRKVLEAIITIGKELKDCNIDEYTTEMKVKDIGRIEIQVKMNGGLRKNKIKRGSEE